MRPDLSIIIVNYNTCELLRACLRSVFQETRGLAFEAIVVDNDSKDDSRAMLEREFPQIKRIFNAENRGFAAANNQALKIAAGNFILLLNSDTEIRGGAIQKTVEFMKLRPEASIVGCKLLNPDGTLQPSCHSFPSVWNLFSESFFFYKIFKRTRFFGKYHMSFFDHNAIREVDVVMGAYMLIRSEVFAAIGLLDEDYFMYAEETDFCYRARKSGYKTFFYPGAAIVHLGGGSVQNLDEKYFSQLHCALLIFLRKHFTGVRLFLTVCLKNLGVVLRVAAYFVAGIFTLDFQWIRKSRYYFCVLLQLGKEVSK